MITIKIGGSVVDDLHPSVVADIKKVRETEEVILVHGGGKEVTKVTEQLGKEPKFVVGSNFCDIGFELDDYNNRLIALSASDNLMKGAAGSAIQNMNVMSGFDETQGIMYSPLTPV